MAKRKIEDANSLLQLLRKGEYEKVIRIANKSISFYERELGTIKVLKSRALRLRGRYREALRMLSVVESSPDFHVQAQCFIEYGDLKMDVYLNEKNDKNKVTLLNQAHSMFNKALMTARDMENTGLNLKASRRIALVLHKNSRYTQAMRSSLTILDSLLEYGDKEEEVRAKMQLARLYCQRKEHEQAEKYAQEALLTSKIRQDPREIAYSFTLLAEISEMCGDLRKALNTYHRALQLFEKLGEKSGFDFTLEKIACVEEKLATTAEGE